ncbi:MAG: hypothetical protein OXE94_15745 [Aestuariivita sp.]|nr:hypothetical protein [Aestuariivita sp.]MCY4201427.1 hypothetical protein [Aestuariivita sp.]MCY4346867.1 hypothetical protein [Aestuariivita sp.]
MTTAASAQDIRAAADASMVLDNQAKEITNGNRLTTAIRNSSIEVPIKSTGYFGLGRDMYNIGTLGLGNERRCPLVNAHRQENTYTPGANFRVEICRGIMHNETYVGVRVYGVICSIGDPSNCQTLDQPLTNPEQYETGGYIALLKPGRECSQEKWPTEKLRRAGAPAYAEWCDYGVLLQ